MRKEILHKNGINIDADLFILLLWTKLYFKPNNECAFTPSALSAAYDNDTDEEVRIEKHIYVHRQVIKKWLYNF